MATIEYSNYATGAGGVAARDVLRTKLRHAPDAIKRAFPQAFPELTSQPNVGVQRPAVSRQRTEPAVAGVLVGAVAPGLSDPVFSPIDGETLRETFAPECWRMMIQEITAGQKVELRFNHHGNEKASTQRGTLRFKIDNAVGLLFEAVFHADDPIRSIWLQDIPAEGAGVSVGMFGAKSDIVAFRGERVRVVRSAHIKHVAVILRTSGMRAVYPAANVIRARAADRLAVADATNAVRVRAWETSKQSVRLTDLYSLYS